MSEKIVQLDEEAIKDELKLENKMYMSMKHLSDVSLVLYA